MNSSICRLPQWCRGEIGLCLVPQLVCVYHLRILWNWNISRMSCIQVLQVPQPVDIVRFLDSGVKKRRAITVQICKLSSCLAQYERFSWLHYWIHLSMFSGLSSHDWSRMASVWYIRNSLLIQVSYFSTGDYCYKPDLRTSCCPQYTIK